MLRVIVQTGVRRRSRFKMPAIGVVGAVRSSLVISLVREQNAPAQFSPSSCRSLLNYAAVQMSRLDRFRTSPARKQMSTGDDTVRR